MYCDNCGSEIKDLNQEFCEDCGNKLSFKIENKPETSDNKVKVLPVRKRGCC